MPIALGQVDWLYLAVLNPALPPAMAVGEMTCESMHD
jgi:hypothetical protein